MTGRKARERGAMKRGWIPGVAGLLLVAFGLGFLAGSRRGRAPKRVTPLPSHGTLPGSPAGSASPCVDIREAGAPVGRTGCVAGKVVRVFMSRGGNTFLDFCPDFRGCPFTSVIFASDKNKFGDLETLHGRRVEIRGAVTLYQNRAEVIIRDPQQIRTTP